MSIERWDETTNSMQVRENGEFVRYTDHAAEIAALRERCGRLTELYNATLVVWCVDATNEDMLRRDIAHAKCIAHNDLAPAAKEQTDGR